MKYKDKKMRKKKKLDLKKNKLKLIKWQTILKKQEKNSN